MERTVFVPDATMDSRKETAVLLVGTAREFGITQRAILAAQGGFWITEELAAIIYDESVQDEPYDPSDHTVHDVEDHVTKNPEQVEAILASEEQGKNRSTLVAWLTEFQETSGNRAAKNTTDKESA